MVETYMSEEWELYEVWEVYNQNDELVHVVPALCLPSASWWDADLDDESDDEPIELPSLETLDTHIYAGNTDALCGSMLCELLNG